MITLYDNPFSPFARKVRMVLDYKGLAATSIDALALAHHDDLRAVNPRAEVPVIVDGEVTVVNSADIVAYLEHRYPDPPILPTDPGARVAARAWERLADGVLDAIIHDISIWTWPTHRRQDTPPPGLIEAGCRDIATILGRMEAALSERDFLCGKLSIADFALFPHVSSLRPLGIGIDAATQPRLSDWNQRMRAQPIVRRDLDYVRRAAREKFADGPSPYESEKIVWRGDRIEWLFHNGFADWWYEEYRSGRALVPGAPPAD
jgi:glutathione S-transferase